MISEDTLRQMSREERAALSRSLAALNAELPSLREGDRRRRRFVLVLTAASVGLIPWIALLGVRLPRHYLAGHWRLTWVGFDIVLLGCLALTAWLAWRRRQAVIVAAFITAALLTCDAWFDVMTAVPADRWLSVLTAVLGELPLAALLITGALRILRLTATRLYVLDPGMPLWRIPLLP